jgi:hypothetical protein
MIKRIFQIFVAASFCQSSVSLADSWVSSHSCSKPYKPYKFTEQYQLDNFNDEVERYKRCMANFIEEQNNEAEEHKEAAENAIQEWNSYVNYELN